MNLKTAIQIQTIHNQHNPDYTDAEREEAHLLSLEAMKDLQNYRLTHNIWPVTLLPGETEE